MIGKTIDTEARDMGTVVVYPQEGSDKRAESDAPVAISSKSVLARTYRGTWFNVVIVGLISFTQAGIWNALYSKCGCFGWGCNLLTTE
jgi:hypothetical protein